MWRRELSGKYRMKHQQTPAGAEQTRKKKEEKKKSVQRSGAAAGDKIPSAKVGTKACSPVSSFSPLNLLQPPVLLAASPFPLPSSFSLVSSSLFSSSVFSCFAAQRGAEPRIPRASCHVKTLIPAKFHTQRLHLWLS